MRPLFFVAAFLISGAASAQNAPEFSVSVRPSSLTPSHVAWPAPTKPEEIAVDERSPEGQLLHEIAQSHKTDIPAAQIAVEVVAARPRAFALNVGASVNGKKELFCHAEMPGEVVKAAFFCSYYLFEPGITHIFVEIVPPLKAGEIWKNDAPVLFSCRSSKASGCAGHFNLKV